MDLTPDVLARLESNKSWGYHQDSENCTEPAAMAALALLAHGRSSSAEPLIDWLLGLQSDNGTVGINAAQPAPAWPTGLAVLAWSLAADSLIGKPAHRAAIDRALAWMLRTEGSINERIESLGHDTTIKGWPWVEGTHAWVEPTAMNLLALNLTGNGNGERAREAVLLLQNRLLPSGGANYGNTVVFRQELRPHVESTGLALWALGPDADDSGLTEKAIDYLNRELSAETTTASLSYGLLGLAAQGRWPNEADRWLEAASRRTLRRDPSTFKLALLALAALGPACPLIPSTREPVAR